MFFLSLAVSIALQSAWRGRNGGFFTSILSSIYTIFYTNI